MRIFGTQLDKILPTWFVLALIAAVILAPYVIADRQPATQTATGEFKGEHRANLITIDLPDGTKISGER